MKAYQCHVQQELSSRLKGKRAWVPGSGGGDNYEYSNSTLNVYHGGRPHRQSTTLACSPSTALTDGPYIKVQKNYAFLSSCIKSSFENIPRGKNPHIFFYVDSMKKTVLDSCQRQKAANQSNYMHTCRTFISLHSFLAFI